MSYVIGNILRSSLTGGCFPDILKKAVLHLKLKNADKDKEQFKSFRPLVNIAFLSKVFENLLLFRLIAILILIACFRHFNRLTANITQLKQPSLSYGSRTIL